ncbi:nSTAND1 domain-containing NTPase [Methylobacter sp.]|uniref:WD40 repeat domain-containing protein n=1 Tax=Methylobacter sp. TaxID=2051955 RepID=UPI003DA64877
MNTNFAHLLPESEQIIVDDERPWPGLASFREQDEHFFKGREPDIKQLHDLVGHERLTVLFGVSGLGKSSLLQAGLFPRLRQNNILPVPIRLDFEETSASFREQVFATIARQVQEKDIEAPLHNENETLWEYFHRKDTEFWDARNHLMVPLLCFDQFEEIFTLGRKDLKRDSDLRKFITEELADLVKGHCPGSVKARLNANPDESKNFNFSHHPYKLIFSLREDYLADLEELRESMPSVIHNRMRLCSMNGERALEVADQTQGRLMERSVAETIVRLVAGEPNEAQRELSVLCVEPALLSLVCRELNERRIANRDIQIDARVVASDREQILENFYERSLKDQSPELRRFVEDKLITVSGFRDSEAYDNAVGMPGITAEALAQLVQRRMLRLEERNGNKRIELIHDVLAGVVRKSRDQRQVLEKQRQAEQEKREAEQKEQAARKALRIERRVWSIGVILASLFAFLLWDKWSDDKAHNKTQHALAEANFREAQQHYHNNNNMPDALAHLAYSIRINPEWVPSRSLLVNLLQQRSWFLPVAIFDHKATVHDASFSPDGTRVLTISAETIKLWKWDGDAQKGKWIGTPMSDEDESKSAIRSAKFSPDGALVVTIAFNGPLTLWDGRTGQRIRQLLKGSQITSVAFDGIRLAAGGQDGILHLWNIQTDQPIVDKPPNSLERHARGISSIAFSPDGTRVATSSWDTKARLWNAQTGHSIGRPMSHKSAVRSVQFSPDGARLLTASNDGTARLWNAQTGTPLAEAKVMEHKDRVLSARFSPDGTRVVTASADSTARLWNAQTGASLPNAEPMVHQDAVLSAQFSLDGMRVVTASADSSARLWDARTGKSLGEAITHQGRVSSAQFSPDGAYVLTASDDNTARLSDTRIGHLGKTMTHQGRALPAQFSPNGTYVLTALKDNILQL